MMTSNTSFSLTSSDAEGDICDTEGDDVTARELGPGVVIAGKYLVERALGVGGMGRVYAARHVDLGHRVAIKAPRRKAARNRESIARFEREARAAAGLVSDHVARVLDVGRLEGGAPYLVMEYLEGEDLGASLARRGRLPIGESLAIALQVCDALAEAHGARIVHRDVKPANLFLAARPGGAAIVKVLDFGISKVTSGDSNPPMSLTNTQVILGSPLYMAPEQLRASRDVDGRADVYSLGVTLYEMLTGTTPYVARSVADLFAKVLTEPPVPPRALRPELPVEVETVLLRALAREAADRYPSIEAFASALSGVTDACYPSARMRALRRSAPPVAFVANGAAATAVFRAAPGHLFASTEQAPPEPSAETPPPVPLSTNPTAPRRARARWFAAAIAFACLGFASPSRFSHRAAAAVLSLTPSFGKAKPTAAALVFPPTRNDAESGALNAARAPSTDADLASPHADVRLPSAPTIGPMPTASDAPATGAAPRASGHPRGRGKPTSAPVTATKPVEPWVAPRESIPAAEPRKSALDLRLQ